MFRLVKRSWKLCCEKRPKDGGAGADSKEFDALARDSVAASDGAAPGPEPEPEPEPDAAGKSDGNCLPCVSSDAGIDQSSI